MVEIDLHGFKHSEVEDKLANLVILQYNMILNESPLIKYYYYCLEHSRYKETALTKFQKYIIKQKKIFLL